MTHASTKPMISACGSGDGECHCYDEAPHEHTDAVVATERSHAATGGWSSFARAVYPYRALIITLTFVIVFGIALSVFIGFSWMSVMEYWMGGYFVAIGAMQALQLRQSAAMLRQYDVFSRHSVAYSYALPFLQIGLGLTYFLMLWWQVTSVVALTVLLSTLFGVDSILRHKSVVRCGCLGEAMNVPVSKVTLWENLIMIGMVVLMFTYHMFYGLVSGGADMTSMPGMTM